MFNTPKTRIAAMAIAVLSATAIAGAVLAIDAGPAYAQGNGNGNGNGDRGGHGDRGGNGNGNGQMARELQGANAANANDRAFENASPNSQVGRMAELRDAMEEAQDEYDAWRDAYRDYVEHRGGYDGRDTEAIQREIDALDPDSDTFADDLDRLEQELRVAQEHEDELDRLMRESNDAMEAYEDEIEPAVLTATNGRELSPEALAELRRRLLQ